MPYEQQVLKSLFLVFYGGVAVLSMIACIYLLLRRGNAFAAGVTPPIRLRRWTATLFAAITLSHVWYLPMYILTSKDWVNLIYLVGGLLDSMTVFPLTIVVLLVMLQDRRRPLWPVGVLVAPLVGAGALCVAVRSVPILPFIYAYFLLMCIGLIIYMVRATKQYGRWLHDNYADLEHKEVWQSLVVMAIMLLALVIYTFEIGGQAYEYVMQVIVAVMVCYFLWRAETLSDLSSAAQDETEERDGQIHPAAAMEEAEHNDSPLSIRNKIGPLLEQYCEEPQLYLQNDISLSQLAKQIGVNRVYLSQHFAMQDTTYNGYINGLRIRHFINLYQEAATAHQPVTVQQLAYRSGFHSYGTFNSAFKQAMGMTATEWMRGVAK